jgi:hypothetical protein
MLLRLFVVSFLHLHQACQKKIQLFIVYIFIPSLDDAHGFYNAYKSLDFFLQCCHEETSWHSDACVFPKHCLST